MRKFGLALLLLVFAAAMALAQNSQDQQSTGDQAKGAVSGAAGAVKSGAQTGYNKTKEGAEKAYGATKGALTGNSNDQTTEQQTSTQTTTTTTHKKLPQTASPLPLLALLGMGSLSFGVWKARLFGR
jgi:flagellar biosynthesis/type III secretory pathway protein FliH